MNCRRVWTTLDSVPTLEFILKMSGNVKHYLRGFLAGERNLYSRFLSFLICPLFFITACSEQSKNQILCFDSAKATVEIVDKATSIRQGLKHRQSDSLCTDCGMFFDWGELRPVKFWMKDTQIPLDIAFIDENYRIVSIDALIPFSETHIASPGPVRYAIEMHRGWFGKNLLSVGDAFKSCS